MNNFFDQFSELDDSTRTSRAFKHPDYKALPGCIQSIFSEKDYASLPDEERLTFKRDICLPDYEEE